MAADIIHTGTTTPNVKWLKEAKTAYAAGDRLAAIAAALIDLAQSERLAQHRDFFDD
jgi:hypothetical protein